jgi:hypothetical protein
MLCLSTPLVWAGSRGEWHNLLRCAELLRCAQHHNWELSLIVYR